MNATYNMDHLQAVTHVTSLLNTSLGNAAAVNKPKTAATSHYDPTGQQIATKSTTSYEGVTFTADGTISGGNLSHESSDPDGTKLSTTAVGFGSNGKPASAQINVHNISGEGDFKKVDMDMSGVTWNNSFAVSSGQVKMSTTDMTTGQKKHDGLIQFAGEAIVSGAITHYDQDNGGAVCGYSDVDYSGAKFLGASLVGGQYAVKSHTADKVLKSTSSIALSDSGRLQTIQTTNMDPASAAVASKVAVDFSKLLFNARNEFHSGDINYTANDNNGTLLSQTTVTYNNAVPALTTTMVYKNGQVQNKIVVDYSASQFNNDHQVVNSTKKVDIFSAASELLFSNIIAYDGQGKKRKDADPQSVKMKAAPPVKAAKAPAAENVVKNASAFKLSVKAGDPGTTQKTDDTHRPDNTLEQRRVTTMQNGKPVSALITLYAADGTTVTKTFTMDLTGLLYDPTSKAVSGALNMQTHLGGNTLSSESAIQY